MINDEFITPPNEEEEIGRLTEELCNLLRKCINKMNDDDNDDYVVTAGNKKEIIEAVEKSSKLISEYGNIDIIPTHHDNKVNSMIQLLSQLSRIYDETDNDDSYIYIENEEFVTTANKEEFVELAKGAEKLLNDLGNIEEILPGYEIEINALRNIYDKIDKDRIIIKGLKESYGSVSIGLRRFSIDALMAFVATRMPESYFENETWKDREREIIKYAEEQYINLKP